LTEPELRSLGELGRRWQRAVPEAPPPLPVDPSLRRTGHIPQPSRFTRFAPVSLFQAEGSGDVVATEAAGGEPAAAAPLVRRLRRVALGPPLISSAVVDERMRKLTAMGVLSGDLLSSVAYGPQAMVTVLALAGVGALSLELPLGIALILLILTVGASYRQTIRAYPTGAGSYIVANNNLGELAGLAAAVGLITDYILTVAVSVAAGVAAVTSALPELQSKQVLLGLIVIAVLLAGNLRGVRQAGQLFAAPTYLFLLAMGILIIGGLVQAAGRGFASVPPPHISVTAVLGPLLILRAFASGATSMTGIEAVSNAVPVFRDVQWRNARTTLTWMVSLLLVLFGALLLLIRINGLVPSSSQTMLSELASGVFGRGAVYVFIQAATALELVFAADTAFNDFPRVLFYMARNDHAPRAFLRIGDRLAYSNGIIVLAVTAAVILAAFGGKTESLIPLYALGVFLAFTLSQAGMVVHWWRRRDRHWRRSLVVNGTGAVASGAVLLTAAVTKFAAGAWVVVVGIPLAVACLLRVKAHYTAVERATIPDAATIEPDVGSLARPGLPGLHPAAGAAPPQAADGPAARAETRHLLIALVLHLDLPSLQALEFAASLRAPVLALHVSTEDSDAQRFRQAWDQWGAHVPLEVVVSPYRAVAGPIVNYIEALHAQRPDVLLTVVLPVIKVRRPWQRPLHSRLGDHLRRALERHRGIAVMEVPFHLPA
jgi:amino acid transporter